MAKNKPSISKDDFIEFLASATPDEITQVILANGKPPKPIKPFIFLSPKKTSKDKNNK